MYREFHRRETESTLNMKAPQYHPDEVAACALLQYMTKEQLEEYLQDTEKLDSMIVDQLRPVQRDRENIIVNNKSLAEFNMSLQPKFESLKHVVASGYEAINSLKMSLGEHVAQLESQSSNQSNDTMVAIFQTEVASAEEESEQIADDFCQGSTNMDTFLSSYIPKRTEAYIKKTKLEKLSELVRQGRSTSAPYSDQFELKSPPASNVYSGAGYGMASAPYPASNFGMPTPYQPR